MRKLCIFIGATSGKPQYEEIARQFAFEVARRGIGIVYGGSKDGLMGIIADIALENGGYVEGVLPESLLAREQPHPRLSKLHIVPDLAARKKLMLELSDGFVALPGGLGTLEELFELWNAAKIGLHDKPCGLFNANHFFDSLIGFLDHATTENFIKAPARALLCVSNEAGELLDQMHFEAEVAEERVFRH